MQRADSKGGIEAELFDYWRANVVAQRFWREALLWRQLKHPHILPLLGIDDSRPQMYSLCMVSPLMDRGHVLGYMEHLGPENVDVLDLVRYIILSAGKNSPFKVCCCIAHADSQRIVLPSWERHCPR
jgi:serine/threonine protein kinase